MKKLTLTVLALLVCANTNAVGPAGSAIAPPDFVKRSVELAGDLGFNTKNLKNEIRGAGVLAAHAICDHLSSGSRAMEYEDIKYVIDDLGTSKYWIVNPYTSVRKMVSDYDALRKDGVIEVFSSLEESNCKDFSEDENVYDGIVLNASTKRLERVTCNTVARIACVK